MTTTAPTQTATSTWNIDASHSTIEFAAKHMMITTVKGRLADAKGTITIDEANPDRSSAVVEFDAASLDTRSEQRDQHLRSADFLDVEKYPTISFKSRRVEGARNEPGTSFKVIGDLTVHGVTKEVTLDAVYEGAGKDPWGGSRVSFSAATKIDRREFGLVWNAALETGGLLVSNDIKVQIEVQAIRAA
ncbi:MAG: YceI family protein [Gemmatimonadota bacterium]|nr:YceI family protein [Gemmatimonadota bacterium]